ncbi:MAG: FeoC-like transcriptional regulator [Thiomicrospira sp.]
MILLELKRYIRQHRQVAAQQLLHRFDISQDTLEDLIAPLLQQGHVYRQRSASGCDANCHSGCRRVQEGEVYYWSERPLIPLNLT